MRKLTNPWADVEGYYCFGCAPNNSHGVKMEFYEDGEEIVSVWQPQTEFQGWLNTLHGGIHSVLLDEICAWVVLRKLQTTGVTSKMETRFKKPVSTKDKYVVLLAHIVAQRRNLVEIKATLYNAQGELCSEATCQYFTFPKEKAAEMFFRDCLPVGQEVSIQEVIDHLQ